MSAMLFFAMLFSIGHAEEVLRFNKGFTNVYAIIGDGGVVLVDAHNPDQEDWIFKRLRRAGIRPEDVTLSLVTHVHVDHAGSAAALQAAGLTVALAEGDVSVAARGDHGVLSPTGAWGRWLEPRISSVFPSFTPDIVITDRLDLRPFGVDGDAVVVGGHTAGSLVVWLTDGVVLSGDLIRSRMIGRRRPALHFFHADLDRAHGNIDRLLDDGAAVLKPAHGGDLRAPRVRRWLSRQAQ
ncbi:MAG: MBL fold metallo-hydrolase [Myxococcota bacterium]